MVAAVWKSKPQLEKNFIHHQQDRGSPVKQLKQPNTKSHRFSDQKIQVNFQREEDCLMLQLPHSNYTVSAENLQPLHGEQTYWPA